MGSLKVLHDNNTQWIRKVNDKNPDYFERTKGGQTPKYLWIGCVDSRVPPEVITGCGPGEMLVHRNIANQVQPNDSNVQAILQFGLTVLNIREVLVVGHTDCGGVRAALSGNTIGNIGSWLKRLERVVQINQKKIQTISVAAEKENTLSKINVIEQVKQVAESEAARSVWLSGESLVIHGLLYDVSTGALNNLNVSISAPPE